MNYCSTFNLICAVKHTVIHTRKSTLGGSSARCPSSPSHGARGAVSGSVPYSKTIQLRIEPINQTGNLSSPTMTSAQLSPMLALFTYNIKLNYKYTDHLVKKLSPWCNACRTCIPSDSWFQSLKTSHTISISLFIYFFCKTFLCMNREQIIDQTYN